MKKLLCQAHETWLAMLMASFMSRETENKRILGEFSEILFRHFTWIEHDLVRRGESYDYNRDNVPIRVERLGVLTADILKRFGDMKSGLSGCTDAALAERIRADLDYMESVLPFLGDEEIRAFDMHRTYRNVELGREATDALTLFLFEESYKEYELIMIYNYLKAHSSDTVLNRIFQVMIEESFFHLRSFCEMMAEMGILGVPRTLHESLYKVEDMEKFLLDGIEEEIAAKEQCRELSDAVASESPELARFFDFINHQENYHIALMKEAAEHYAGRSAYE